MLKVRLLPGCWDGEGTGQDPHTNARGFPIPSAKSLRAPSASIVWDLQEARLGPAGWGNGQGQTAVPDFLPLRINQRFSESQTWLCLWDISYEIQKLIQLGSFG